MRIFDRFLCKFSYTLRFLAFIMFLFADTILFAAVASQQVLDASTLRPAVGVDFPDPSIINANGTWHAFATNGNGFHVQYANSSNFDDWANVNVVDVLPALPGWVSPRTPNIWAPSVIQTVDSSPISH